MHLTLASAGRSLRPVSAVSAADVRSWFERRVPMVLPTQAVELLDLWQRDLGEGKSSTLPGWRPGGPGRSPDEASPLIAFLREHALSGAPFTLNALHREKQGGRSYPFFIEGYAGPLTISKKKYQAAKQLGPRLMLSAIRRDVRARLQVPGGWSLIELDFTGCHAAIGRALSGDEQLGADVENDIHQIIGDLAFCDLPDVVARRAAGKRLNNQMLFGSTPFGISKLTREVLGRDPKDGTGETAWAAWWARYPKLADLRDEVQAMVAQAQAMRGTIEIEAPSGRLSKFSAAEVRGQSFSGRPDRGPDAVWRTVFSACFRAVEGDLLDATLRYFHSDGADGQPVLPLYDGMLIAAPTGDEEAVVKAALQAATRAAKKLGLDKLRATVKLQRA